jgi:hypothetical protein
VDEVLSVEFEDVVQRRYHRHVQNARAATEPGVAAWIAIEICALVSGSTRRMARAAPVTGIARNHVCGTTLAHAPVAYMA